MLPTVAFPYAIGFTSELFLILGFTLTIYYNYICFKLYNYKKNKFEIKIAKQIFAYSIFYLFLIFLLFLIDKLI